jgi:hypothetical protein
LIDARDGTHVWAERYDRSIEDIFAIQDEITLILATEMHVRLTDGEQARLRYTTTHNVEAWTCWVQGLSYYRQAITKENMAAVQLWWEKALALDPPSAVLNAMLGFIHFVKARFGWSDNREAEFTSRKHTPTVRSSSIRPAPTLTLSSVSCVGRRNALTRRFPTPEKPSNWRPAPPIF